MKQQCAPWLAGVGTLALVHVLAVLSTGCPADGDGDADLDASLDGPLVDGEAGPSDGLVGDPCITSEDCLFEGATCLRYSWGFQDGYCTILGARDIDHCESADLDAKFVQLPCARAVCMNRCVYPEDCRDGYECLPSVEACWPRCQPGRACPLPPPSVCQSDDECDDSDPCTRDGCVDDECAHERISDLPRRVARLATTGPALDVDLTGRLDRGNLRLFIAEGWDGVEAVDLSNPSQPALAFRVETVGEALSLSAVSGRLAVAEGVSGVEVFSDQGGTALGIIPIADGAGSALSVGEFIYAYRDGALSWNVANITTGAACDTRGRAVDGIWLSDHRVLLVADSLSGISVCDWAEGTTPLEVNRVASEGRVLSLSRQNNTIAAAEAGAGVGILDITDPFNPVRRDTTPSLAGEALEVRLAGQKSLFVAANEGGVYAFALEDCFVPETWYRWETDGPALGIDIVDGLLAIAMGEQGVDILDLGCRYSVEEDQ